MAKLDGGIFSRPRGKTGGIVFGAARTRAGKVATARQLVPPSNPNTQAQQTQRTKFKESLEIVRQIGKAVYGADFNRSISQLPGFQSMMSIFMNAMDDNYHLGTPSTTNLGSLHVPVQITAVPGANVGEIDLDWSTELGPNGQDDDPFSRIVVASKPGATAKDRLVLALTQGVRLDGSSTPSGFDAGESYIFGLYFKGATANQGLLSNVTWLQSNAG